MAVEAAGRAKGISKTDLDASRLVFVFVKGSKPKRKVAVPIPDDCTWEGFVAQVKAKLRISEVHSLYLSSTGKKVDRLDELQDIDELAVQEAPAKIVLENGHHPPSQPEASPRTGPQSVTTPSSSAAEISPQSVEHTSVPIHRSQSLSQHPERQKTAKVIDLDDIVEEDEITEEQKYTKRSNPWRRTMQRLWSVFAPQTLPITTRDPQLDDKLRRRRKQPFVSWRNVFLLMALVLCFGTMMYLYYRMSI